MGTDRSDLPASPLTARTATVVVLSLGVAVVLGDAGVVTLALPEILRDFGAQVWGVAWVLIAFNLVLALVAVPGARLCVRGDPAVATVGGVIGFAAATTVCAVAPSLGVLIAARAAQAAGGALVIVGTLELLVAATGVERAGVRRWAAAGVAGAALGPVIGGLLTSAFSWRAIFVVQIPIVLLALPAAITLRGRVVERRHRPTLDTSPDRPHVLANLALALLSAALTAAVFLLVLLLVDGWSRSPAVAAVAVTAVPVAALAAGPVFRGVRAGTRSEAVAGSVLIAGGLTGLALLPGAQLVWTLAPQVLIGLGLGLSVDSLTAAALRDRIHARFTGAGRSPRGMPAWWSASRSSPRSSPPTCATPRPRPRRRSCASSSTRRSPPPQSSTSPNSWGAGCQPNAAGCPTCGPRSRPCECRPRRRPPSPPWSVASRISSSAPPPRVPHVVPRRRGTGAAGARACAGAARPESLMRRLALPLIAVVLVAAVLGVQVAAGGGHYVPLRPANPCTPRPVSPVPAQLEPLAEQIVLLGLDSAACRLGISRERLVLALAETRSLDPRESAALKTGLVDAVDLLDRQRRLPKVSELLPQALDQANLPGIVKTIIGAIPDPIVDNLASGDC